MAEFDKSMKMKLAEIASEFAPHEVELDITDFTIEDTDKQDIHLCINVNAQNLSYFTEQMRSHIAKLTPYQQDCYHMAIEILKTTDYTANQAALAWLYEIAEANPKSPMAREINLFMGYCLADSQ